MHRRTRTPRGPCQCDVFKLICTHDQLVHPSPLFQAIPYSHAASIQSLYELPMTVAVAMGAESSVAKLARVPDAPAPVLPYSAYVTWSVLYPVAEPVSTAIIFREGSNVLGRRAAPFLPARRLSIDRVSEREAEREALGSHVASKDGVLEDNSCIVPPRSAEEYSACTLWHSALAVLDSDQVPRRSYLDDAMVYHIPVGVVRATARCCDGARPDSLPKDIG